MRSVLIGFLRLGRWNTVRIRRSRRILKDIESYITISSKELNLVNALELKNRPSPFNQCDNNT